MSHACHFIRSHELNMSHACRFSNEEVESRGLEMQPSLLSCDLRHRAYQTNNKREPQNKSKETTSYGCQREKLTIFLTAVQF